MPHFGFGTQHRIRRKADFERLQREGRKLYSKHFLVVVTPSPSTDSRLAIAVTKKVEPRATRRNFLRRRLKEIFRLHQAKLKAPFDILIVARKNAPACEFADIKREVIGALYHGGLLLETQGASH